MEKIATLKRTKEIVENNAFSLKKNFGQNFLIDGHVISKIISASEIKDDELVIEIGPGIGSLTEELLQRAKKVICIEIDRTLIPILEENFKDYDNLLIINEDILKVDLKKIIEDNGFKTAKIVANLPYYITTPIIMDCLEKGYPITHIVVMIQKEVAYRMNAKPSTKDYGALSIVVNYFADTYLVANVPPNCFMPRPNVDSAVIRITKLDKPRANPNNEEMFFKLIKAGFSMRRKTLVNCMFNMPEVSLSKEELENLLESININKKIRGEALDIHEYVSISNTLFN